MLTIQNEHIKASINPKGAELVSLFHIGNQTEYMWEGNPEFWGKYSPVLFPIVGSLKNNTYFYQNQPYQLSRHGFARDKTFVVEQHDEQGVTLLLTHDDTTLAVFPFAFEFRLRYELVKNTLQVSYLVNNPADSTLWFSVGGHPAFRIPLTPDTQYQDYYLQFNQQEDFPRWPLSAEGLILTVPNPFLTNTNRLDLTKELFYEDAIVFKNYQSDSVVLKSDKTTHQLQFDFPNFPFLGIWAAKNANFVCIEPWCGIADHVDHNQDITQKEGIIALNPAETFERTWSVRIS
ncbi:aldose 1-epimerase family protein [Flectobacillus major]|uniref:aldose 1-epimerase family protein n=1 Tax=Flectobacillus major TaxID=103 RepID=UPI0003FC14B7|nr:aldose 1-epimerase family protein [Flectobacillus major]